MEADDPEWNPASNTKKRMRHLQKYRRDIGEKLAHHFRQLRKMFKARYLWKELREFSVTIDRSPPDMKNPPASIPLDFKVL